MDAYTILWIIIRMRIKLGRCTDFGRERQGGLRREREVRWTTGQVKAPRTIIETCMNQDRAVKKVMKMGWRGTVPKQKQEQRVPGNLTTYSRQTAVRLVLKVAPVALVEESEGHFA
jgi:hypothetical protein